MPSYRCVVDLRFAAGGGGGTNTWHIRTAGVGDAIGDELDIAMGWVEQFYLETNLMVPNASTASWNGIAQEILTLEPTFAAPRSSWTVQGAGGLSYGAAAGMACVTWRSELASRSGRGRTFIGPLARDVVQEDGSLATGALGSLRLAANNLVSSSNTNDNVGAVGVFSPTDNVIRDVVAATVTDQVAVLRSRRN